MTLKVVPNRIHQWFCYRTTSNNKPWHWTGYTNGCATGLLFPLKLWHRIRYTCTQAYLKLVCIGVTVPRPTWATNGVIMASICDMYPGLPEPQWVCACTQAYLSHKWCDDGSYPRHPAAGTQTHGSHWCWIELQPKTKGIHVGPNRRRKTKQTKKWDSNSKKTKNEHYLLWQNTACEFGGVSPFFQKKRKASTGKEIAKKYFDYNGVKQKLFASLIIHVFFFWVHIHQSGVTCTPICLQKNQICTLKIL